MAIVGISGSPMVDGNTDRITKAILEASGKKTSFVNLSKLQYSPCRGCAHRCATTGMCGEKDELLPYLKEIKNADALVLSSSVHHSGMTGWMYSFYTRLWCFGHSEVLLSGKPVIYVWTGLFDVMDQKEHGLFDNPSARKNEFNVLGQIYYSSRIPPCLKCGAGSYCKSGGLWCMLGESEEALANFEFVPENFKRWEDDPATVEQVAKYGEMLRKL